MNKSVFWSLLGFMVCVLTFTACSSDNDVNATGVSLSEKDILIEKGSSHSLKAVVSPENATNKDVKWTTSDANIASVDNTGNVTALKTGTATITVSLVGGNFMAQCKVTVTSAVSGITLNKTSLSIEEGKTDILTATILPDDATNKGVTWTSDNESIAKVSSNGEITAIKPGTATISATTTDQNKTAQCKITVISTVSGVTLNKTSLSITEGKTDMLIAAIIPDDATNKGVTWTSDNESIAEVSSNGEITAIKPGTATITVTTTDQNKTAQCKVTVTSSKDINYKPYGDSQNW